YTGVMDVAYSKNGVPIRLSDERYSHIVENHGELPATATMSWPWSRIPNGSRAASAATLPQLSPAPARDRQRNARRRRDHSQTRQANRGLDDPRRLNPVSQIVVGLREEPRASSGPPAWSTSSCRT